VICNFNDVTNVEGTGTTIVALHPVVGSRPTRVAQDPSLKGCDALTLDPNDTIYTAAYLSNLAPIVNPSGAVLTTNANKAWSGPWGAIYSGTSGPFGSSSVFESNANSGTLARMDVKNGTVTNVETIVTGFQPNTGVPGSILGPAGLTYDASSDTLYVVDSGANRLLAFAKASTIPAGGIVVSGNGFGGTAAAAARIVYAGAPLNAPISAALLANGNIAVGNTGDNNMFEFTPSGSLLATRLVDNGPTGAIFGIVATGTTAANEKIYFNDDNTNSVILISQ
jgi:sugar lactone lactonase YvrE